MNRIVLMPLKDCSSWSYWKIGRKGAFEVCELRKCFCIAMKMNSFQAAVPSLLYHGCKEKLPKFQFWLGRFRLTDFCLPNIISIFIFIPGLQDIECSVLYFMFTIKIYMWIICFLGSNKLHMWHNRPSPTKTVSPCETMIKWGSYCADKGRVQKIKMEI